MKRVLAGEPLDGGGGSAGGVGRGGSVTGDLVCVRCGYLLRGQGSDARCPECGGTVQLTIDAQQLQSWPPAWLARLRRGLRLLVAGVAIGWVSVLVFSLATLSLIA